VSINFVQKSLFLKATRVEPIIYERIDLKFDRARFFLRTLASHAAGETTKPPAFFATRVKRLYIWQRPPDEVTSILSACTGISALAYWPSPSSVPNHHQVITVIHHLRPQRLHTRLNNLLGTKSPDFDHPFFSQITHLEINNTWSTWSSWDGLGSLTSLRYLTLDLSSCQPPFVYENIVNLINRVMSHCLGLRVCVILVSPYGTYGIVDENVMTTHEKIPGVEDPRVVLLPKRLVARMCSHSPFESPAWELGEEIVKTRTICLGDL